MTDTRFRLQSGDVRELQRTFEQVPRASHISTSDGPNSSGETGTKGQLAIDRGSSDTDLWICHDDGTSNWSEYQPSGSGNFAGSSHTHEGSDLSAADGSTFSFFDPMIAPEIETQSDATIGGTLNPGSNVTVGSSLAVGSDGTFGGGLEWGGTGQISKSSHVVQFTANVYNISNANLNKSFDRSTVTVGELADVVNTILSDLSMQ